MNPIAPAPAPVLEPTLSQTLGQAVDRVRDAGEKKPSVFTIGDLAREFRVTLRTLRFYEDKGLLNPRRDGLTRIYSRRDRARLRLILMGKSVGFSLRQIKEILDLYDVRDGEVIQLRVALEKFGEQIKVLQAQKSDVERAIDELKRSSKIITHMLRQREDGQNGHGLANTKEMCEKTA